MTNKRSDRHKEEQEELQLDFDEAKGLTVGQAMRKNEEVEAGVLPSDSILDKYVKQHKEEIEADKFETRQYKTEDLVETQTLEELIQGVRESVDDLEDYSEEMPSSEETIHLPFNELEKAIDPFIVEDGRHSEGVLEEVVGPPSLSDQEDSGKRKKKLFRDSLASSINAYLCRCLLCLPSSFSLNKGNPNFSVNIK